MMDTVAWRVTFDWAGDGTYAGGPDGPGDESARLLHPLRVRRGRDGEFADFKAGEATLTLDNRDGRYDPWNMASPLYPDVQPGVGVRVVALAGGVEYPVFAGRIEDVVLHGELGERRATITALDGARGLLENEIAVGLRQGLRTDEAIAQVLDEVGWPAAARDLMVGNDTLAYWWTPKRKAIEIIRDLARSELGLFFVDREGRAVFRNRASVVTGVVTGALDAGHLQELEVINPWQAVYNRVKVTCNPVQVAPEGALWSLLDQGVTLGPGETREVWAEFQDANGNACAAADVVSPVAGADYAANTAADGSGQDMTAALAVTATVFSTTAKLRLANIDATRTLYVTKLQVRGRALVVQPTTVIGEDAGSQARYGRRELALELRWQGNVLVATDMARALVGFYAQPRRSLVWRMMMVPAPVLGYDLDTRVRATAELNGVLVDEELRVGAVELETVDVLPGRVRGTLWLEPCNTTTFWLRGVPGNSERGITTRYGY